MNQNEAILIGLLAAPVLLMMVLRINATLVFLSLCLGYVLMTFVGVDVKQFAELFMKHTDVSINIMKLVLLLFPAVFTALFMIKTVRSAAKLILNLLPAIGAGCLVVLFVVPLLPPGLSEGIVRLRLWHEATRLQDMVVGVSALISVFFLWAQRPRKSDDEKGKK